MCPIIDMNAAAIGEALGQTERIAVQITTHRIEIKPSRIAVAQAARVLTALAVGLFAGGGLMSQAAKAAGFETVAVNEISEGFAAVHEANHGGRTLNSSVEDADLHSVARKHTIGLLHAGIPCEPFSAIRRNAGDKYGHAWRRINCPGRARWR